jgi:tetratricopeptide (TPR) repeat protein
MRRGQHAAAREPLTEALKLKDDYRVRMLLARSHEQSNELWPAAHHLQKAIAGAPAGTRLRLHVQLGQIYLKLGKKAHACQTLKAVAGYGPADALIERNCR